MYGFDPVFISEFDNGYVKHGISTFNCLQMITAAGMAFSADATSMLRLVLATLPFDEVLLFWTDCRLSHLLSDEGFKKTRLRHTRDAQE